ncbi:uncharacterized protein LOC128217712 [Mya arenaria]|uniref:uncharacterized protein LOC128217712 n=1 Tax=Mya arenaria TaxID=6604 RepID=UPI0022E4BBBD|nr:uncharacterized protein LOC128217712 [Mya arenaria]
MAPLARLAFLLGVFLLLQDVISAKRPKGKGKMKQKLTDGSMDEDEEIRNIKDKLAIIEAKLDGSSDSSAIKGGCQGSGVHFYFHSGDESHPMSDQDQHVHVHLDGEDSGSHEGHHHHHHQDESHDHDEHMDSHDTDHDDHPHDHFAHADFSNPDDNIIGFVQVQQNTNERGANFYFEFSKLPGNDAEFHVHVHEFGDVSDNCNNIGGHYDPILPDEDVGNLGHIETNSNSAVEGVWKNGTDLTIYGDHSIVGRSIAIHESDGTKIACAVIGWCSENTHHHHD